MKLSRTVIYALKATLQLAEHGGSTPVSCGRLANQGEMPERFLLQILRNLVTHGILKSARGVEGGYSLQQTPQEISVLDIMEAIEGPVALQAVFGEGLPNNSEGLLREQLEQVTHTTREQLRAIRIGNLVSSGMTACELGRNGAKLGAAARSPVVEHEPAKESIPAMNGLNGNGTRTPVSTFAANRRTGVSANT